MNKKCFLLTLIIGIILLHTTVFANQEIDQSIFNEIRQKGYESLYVDSDDGHYTIKNNFETIGYETIDAFIEFSMTVINHDQNAKSISCYAYLDDMPYFKMYIPGTVIKAYIDGGIDEVALMEKSYYADYRPIEEILYTDLSLFDTEIDMVAIHNNKLYVDLSYYGESVEMMFSDYIDMSRICIENAPWIKEVQFLFSDKDNSNYLLITNKKEDVVEYYQDLLTPESFFERSKIETLKKGSFSYILYSSKRIALMIYDKYTIPVLVVLGFLVLLILIAIIRKSIKKK